jgi:hypothetical protein
MTSSTKDRRNVMRAYQSVLKRYVRDLLNDVSNDAATLSATPRLVIRNSESLSRGKGIATLVYILRNPMLFDIGEEIPLLLSLHPELGEAVSTFTDEEHGE